MSYFFYIVFRVSLFVFGVLAIGYGFRGLIMSKAESYNAESFMLNFWGSFVMLCIGLVLTAIGVIWVKSLV